MENKEELKKRTAVEEFHELTDEELDHVAGGQNDIAMMKVADYNNGSEKTEKQIHEYPGKTEEQTHEDPEKKKK